MQSLKNRLSTLTRKRIRRRRRSISMWRTNTPAFIPACTRRGTRQSGASSTCWKVTAMITLARMLMYGKEASNRKQEIDRQHHTIPNQRNQRPKDKHRGNVYNLLFRHGKVRSQNMEKLRGSFPTFCKQAFPQLHKTASYAHYAQCRLLRNPSHTYIFF